MEDHETQALEVVGGNVVELQERAQIDTQIATAKRYPRNVAAVRTKMLSIATMDEATAAACFYALPRGGKTINGPSVRLAEIALSAYGNVRAATRILSVSTGENPHCVVQAVCHDLEGNTVFSVEKRRRITAKKDRTGNRKPVDDDDIQLAVNAGSAIAFRDAVFKVVPGALVKPVLEQAMRVAVGDVKSLGKKRDQVIARLKQMGAMEAQILAAVGVAKVDDIDADKLGELIGIGTALKDGSITLEDAFLIAQQPAKTVFAPPVQAAPAPTAEFPPVPVAVEPLNVKTASSEPVETSPKRGRPIITHLADLETAERGVETLPKTGGPIVTRDQQAIGDAIAEAGATFDNFRAWAVGQEFAGAADWTGIYDVPDKVAVTLAKAQAGLVRQLKAAI